MATDSNTTTTTETEASRIVRNILDRYDGNQDGLITSAEFKDALTKEGLPGTTVTAIFNQVFVNWDKDNDKKLSKSEIQKAAEVWASFPGDQSA